MTYVQTDETFHITGIATSAAAIGNSFNVAVPDARDIQYSPQPGIIYVPKRGQKIPVPTPNKTKQGGTVFTIPMDDSTNTYLGKEERFMGTKQVYKDGNTSKRAIVTKGMITEAVPALIDGLDHIRITLAWTEDWNTSGTS